MTEITSKTRGTHHHPAMRNLKAIGSADHDDGLTLDYTVD